jgi:hypothetical protein
MKGLQPELRPPWRRVPRLVWAMARADAPAPGKWGAAQAVVTGAFLTAPVVAGAHAVGQLASQDPHALLVVRVDESLRRRLARWVAGAAVVAVPWILALGAFWVAFTRLIEAVLPTRRTVRLTTVEGAGYVAQLAAGTVILAAVGLVSLAVFAVVVTPGPKVLRETLDGIRHERAARTRHGVTRGSSIYLEAYAAWPRGCGHGSSLFERVLPVVDAMAASAGRPVVVVARNATLVREYRRLGLTPVEPGSLVLVRRPGL